MERTANDAWDKYYKVASRRRREVGGDPLTRLRKQHMRREKLLLASAAGAMAGIVSAFYAFLV